jgi:hypothetical protein
MKHTRFPVDANVNFGSLWFQGALVSAICIATADQLHRKKELFNPFFRTKVTKMNATWTKLAVCFVAGGLAAYLLVVYLFNPHDAQQAFFAAFAAAACIHDGRVSQLIGDEKKASRATD